MKKASVLLAFVVKLLLNLLSRPVVIFFVL